MHDVDGLRVAERADLHHVAIFGNIVPQHQFQHLLPALVPGGRVIGGDIRCKRRFLVVRQRQALDNAARLVRVQTAQGITRHGGKLLRAGVHLLLRQIVGGGGRSRTATAAAAVVAGKELRQPPAAKTNHQRGGNQRGREAGLPWFLALRLRLKFGLRVVVWHEISFS